MHKRTATNESIDAMRCEWHLDWTNEVHFLSLSEPMVRRKLGAFHRKKNSNNFDGCSRSLDSGDVGCRGGTRNIYSKYTI